jgi:hypothetical protein
MPLTLILSQRERKQEKQKISSLPLERVRVRERHSKIELSRRVAQSNPTPIRLVPIIVAF